MAKKNENTQEVNQQDAYSIDILEKSESLSVEDVLASTNIDTLPQLSSLEGEKGVQFRGRIKFAVHNPFAKDENGESKPDYTVYVYITNDNLAYYTSSESFDSSYRQIVTMAEKMGVKDLKLDIIKKQSKNNAGSMLLAKFSN